MSVLEPSAARVKELRDTRQISVFEARKIAQRERVERASAEMRTAAQLEYPENVLLLDVLDTLIAEVFK